MLTLITSCFARFSVEVLCMQGQPPDMHVYAFLLLARGTRNKALDDEMDRFLENGNYSNDSNHLNDLWAQMQGELQKVYRLPYPRHAIFTFLKPSDIGQKGEEGSRRVVIVNGKEFGHLLQQIWSSRYVRVVCVCV